MKYLITFLLTGGLCFSLFSQSNLLITSTCDFTSICNTSNTCDGAFANLTATATTDCSMGNSLIFNYQIDLDNNNSIDISGNGNTPNDFVPMGEHRIIFTVTDQCNSSESCEFLFEIKDCTAPTPVCIFGIGTVVMPMSGTVTIHADDFESMMSSDNCTDYNDLIFSFSENPNAQTMEIECGDLPPDGLLPLTIFVTDQEGNFDFCSTFVAIQDPNGACDGNSTSTNIIKSITVSGIDLEDVDYDINGFSVQANSIPTFSLNNGDIITPSKSNNPQNGVTTFDLVLITKHILNESPFDEPWQLLAADVNENGSITALDRVLLRALILQIIPELPSGKSWIFDPTSLEYDESFSFFNFVGIKLGDVNDTSSPMFTSNQNETRTNENTLNFLTKNKKFKSAETITTSIFSENFNSIIGSQFTIKFDPSVLEFQNIEGNTNLQLGDENFGLTLVEEGTILCSWNAEEGKNLAPEKPFFTLNFFTKKDGRLSDYLTINSQEITAEAYVEDKNQIDFWNINLNFKDEAISTELSVFPNPFFEKTVLTFSLEKTSDATLNIFNINGQIVFSQQKTVSIGENKWEISKSKLPATGVYFVEIITNGEILTKKIIAK